MAKGKFPFFGKETKAEEKAEMKSKRKFADGGQIPPQQIAALQQLLARGAGQGRGMPPQMPPQAGARPPMPAMPPQRPPGMKCGGDVKKYAKGGGIESKGKTKGRMC